MNTSIGKRAFNMESLYVLLSLFVTSQYAYAMLHGKMAGMLFRVHH